MISIGLYFGFFQAGWKLFDLKLASFGFKQMEHDVGLVLMFSLAISWTGLFGVGLSFWGEVDLGRLWYKGITSSCGVQGVQGKVSVQKC